MTWVRRAATRAYSLALLAFPPQHRAVYAAEMLETFERNVTAHARDRGAWLALRFVVAACLDAVAAGLGERRRHRVADHASARSHGARALGLGIGRDLAHAVRVLAKARTFTFVCVVSLGLGLGVVFSMAIFLRALTATPPGVDADGLVELVVRPLGPLRAKAGDWAIETWSYPDFEDLKNASAGLAVTGWTVGDGVLRASDISPQPVSSMYVSANYFSSVGVVPAEGRPFNAADEDASQAPPVLVVSHRLWRDRLGADPDIVGRTVTFNRVEHVVIGITPEGFLGHMNRREVGPTDVWVPLGQHPLLTREDGPRRDRDADWLRVFARLSPGRSLVDANGAVSSVMAGLAAQFPTSHEYKAASVEPYTSIGANQRMEIGIVKAMFFAMSGMALLVVCLNVAGMVLVRSATRERELAVRLALGASRGRLVRYLMSEAVVLALVGGSLSVAVVYSGFATLAWWQDFPVPDEWRLNASRVAACLAIALSTTLVFGLLPSLRFSRAKIIRAIKDDAGSGGWRVGRIQRVAVAVQAGLALPFLVIGGLLVDGARTTATTDLGFEPEGLFASAMSVSAAGYADEDAGFFLRRAQENLRQASGVAAVTVADGLPLDYNLRSTRLSLENGGAQARGHVTRVGENYLATLGTPLLRGRGITDDDRAGGERVAVISESVALQLFPGQEAVGQRLASALDETTDDVFTIVGVTADAATSQMQTARHQIFVPLAQHPAPRVFLIARAAADSQAMTAAFEKAIADLDPDFSRPLVVSGATLVDDNIRDLLTQSALAVTVAGVALMLSALGIYGVVAFMVATRTREIGVRMALGASRQRVLAGVLADAFKLTLPGAVGGLVLAVFLVRQTEMLGLLWYRLGAVEPLVYAVAASAAIAVAVLASVPSARRAAAVQPIDAMRSE